MQYYLAVDIGASSGRHVLAWNEAGRIQMQEVYRFENQPIKQDGHLCWDIDGLFHHVVEGMKQCRAAGKIPASMGIDTWAVDFALLDENGERLGPVVAYRDKRTEGMYDVVHSRIPFPALYSRTGIQKQSFNTVYQLAAVQKNHQQLLEKAQHLLMVPDYLHYLLTGKMAQEYTNATTTALVNGRDHEWDMQLLDALGLPRRLFGPLSMPGTALGRLSDAIAQEVGFTCEVVLPATHDTASAYLAVPARDESAVYLSSGTWSLLGIETPEPFLEQVAARANFTNEGGYERRFRLLKNIMGLWMIQSIRREGGKKYSFAELEAMARASEYDGVVDANSEAFLAPESMINAVAEACESAGYKRPEDLGDIMRCVYRSLALCYRDAIRQLSAITERKFTSVNIVGGGSKDGYLNQLTADATGLPVYAGPTEGTVLGNLMVQMLAAGELGGLQAARDAVRESFTIQEFSPKT